MKELPGRCKPHDFHHHLVAVGGAVKGAGAGAVVGSRFRRQQFFPADLADCVYACRARAFSLLVIPLVMGPAGHEKGGQVAETECADQQTRHDLVADAQVQRAVEHVVAHADGRRHARSGRG